MKNTINRIILALLCVGIYSCDKENNNIEELPVTAAKVLPITIKNGALQFSSLEVFKETLNKHDEMSQDEFNSWELENGFKSLKTEIDLAYDAMDLAKDSLDFETIINEYKDILAVNGDVIEPIIVSNTYAQVVNRNGEYYIGNVLHKVLGNKIAISLNGDNNAVNSALSENSSTSKSGKSKENKDLFVFEYSKKEKNGSEASSKKTDALSNTLTTSRRRVKLDMTAVEITGWYVSKYLYNGYYPQEVTTYRTRKMEVRVSNYRKTWGRFRAYSNPCTIRNVSYQLQGDYSRSYSRSYSGTHHTLTVSQVISSQQRVWNYGDPNMTVPYENQPVIIKAYAQGWNQGTGSWVTISK